MWVHTDTVILMSLRDKLTIKHRTAAYGFLHPVLLDIEVCVCVCLCVRVERCSGRPLFWQACLECQPFFWERGNTRNQNKLASVCTQSSLFDPLYSLLVQTPTHSWPLLGSRRVSTLLWTVITPTLMWLKIFMALHSGSAFFSTSESHTLLYSTCYSFYSLTDVAFFPFLPIKQCFSKMFCYTPFLQK